MLRAGVAKRKSFYVTVKDLHTAKPIATSTDAQPDWPPRQAEGDSHFSWPQFDENTACGRCYTSGTTGKPKGVLFSLRSNVLHAMEAQAADSLGVNCLDTVMPVVSMFYANAWSLAHTCPMGGVACCRFHGH